MPWSRYIFLRISPNPTVGLGKDGFYFRRVPVPERWKRDLGGNPFDNIADYFGQIPFSPFRTLEVGNMNPWKKRAYMGLKKTGY